MTTIMLNRIAFSAIVAIPAGLAVAWLLDFLPVVITRGRLPGYELVKTCDQQED